MATQRYIKPQLISKQYSTKLYRAYLKLLEKKLGRERTKSILEQTGVPWEHIEADSNWVSDEFAERFYEALENEKELGSNFSYEVGCFAMSREMRGPAIILAMQLLSPVAIFKQIKKFSDDYNKNDSIEVKASSSHSVELTFRSHRKTRHLKTICGEWQGVIESIPGLFNLPKGTYLTKIVDEQTILFSVSWKGGNSYVLLQRLYLLSSLAFCSLLLLLTKNFIFGQAVHFTSTLACFLAAFALGAQQKLISIRKNLSGGPEFLEKMILEQNSRYDELLENKARLNRRYQESRLLYDVINRLTSAQNAKDLIQVTVNEIQQRLKYDRVIFLSHNRKQNSLDVHATSGFDQKISHLIGNYRADLKLTTADPNHIGNVYKEGRNVLVKVNQEYMDSLTTPEGKAMVKLLGSRYFLICTVPEHGLLLVDYIQPDKILDQDDLYFIHFISKELAICLDNAAAAEKERSIRATFQQFVPKQVIQAALGESHSELNDGINRPVTILMSDIRGFTTLSEEAHSKGQSKLMVAALNYYLDIMSEIVYKNGGIVDKYIGDAVLATFNVFGDLPDHQLKAVQTAKQMTNALPTVNQYIRESIYKSEDVPQFYIGIGLNSGEGIVGNIGSARKREFTVIGDVVNTAARIEGETKKVHNGILMSENLREVAQKFFHVEAYGAPKELKGKEGIHILYLLKDNKYEL